MAARIAIDGQDIHDVTLESLRAAIGVVTQEADPVRRKRGGQYRAGPPGRHRSRNRNRRARRRRA